MSLHQLPYIDDPDVFLDLVVKSGLVCRKSLDGVLQRYREVYLPAHPLPDGITALCCFLVADGLLTTWQCGKLRRGQYKGFFLDHFLLLDQLGSDKTATHFLASDRGNSLFVRLAVRQGTNSKGDFSYEVQSEST